MLNCLEQGQEVRSDLGSGVAGQGVPWASVSEEYAAKRMKMGRRRLKWSEEEVGEDLLQNIHHCEDYSVKTLDANRVRALPKRELYTIWKNTNNKATKKIYYSLSPLRSVCTYCPADTETCPDKTPAKAPVQQQAETEVRIFVNYCCKARLCKYIAWLPGRLIAWLPRLEAPNNGEGNSGNIA